jgi:hypothetical protein
MMASDDASSHRSPGLLHQLLQRLLQLFRPKDTSRSTLDQPSCDSIAKELDGLHGHRIPEYDAAIRSCSVTLQQIAEARHQIHQSHVREKNSLICYEKLLWKAYQQTHGTILEYYFSMDQSAAVVLIDPPGRKTKDIDLFYPIDELSKLTPRIETVLWTCVSQFQTIAELELEFKGQDAVFLELYLVVIYLFVVVESQQFSHQMEELQPSYTEEAQRPQPAKESQDDPNVSTPDIPGSPKAIESQTEKLIEVTLKYANSRLSELSDRINQFAKRDLQDDLNPGSRKAIEGQPDERITMALRYANSRLSELSDRINQFAKREAQLEYVRGMLPGGLLVLAPVVIYVIGLYIVGLFQNWTSDIYLSWVLIAIAVTCGALGATVSVLLRVANQPLSVDYHAGRDLIRTAGIARPLVGAVFGLMFYIIIIAGLLQVLTAPSDMVSRAHYIAAICFVAGFSERRAQDVIMRALPTGAATEAPADKPLGRRPEEDRAS